jgi:hypothetical protein
MAARELVRPSRAQHELRRLDVHVPLHSDEVTRGG